MKEIYGVNPMTEVMKWALTGLLLVLGVTLNYTYAEQLSLLLRVAATVLIFSTAGFTAFKTRLGQQVWEFALSSRAEIRKVVWPTRQETVQVSIIVVVMVIIMSLILWGFDMALFKLMAWFTGQGA
jgi:preprotein translocase subunit SecE